MERVSELEEQLEHARCLQLTIERNNHLFEALLASSQDGIALTRLDGSMIRIVRPIAGWDPGDTAGMTVFDFVHPEDAPAVRETYRQFAEKRISRISHELRLLRPDGSAVRIEGTVTDMLDDPAVQAIVHNYRKR